MSDATVTFNTRAARAIRSAFEARKDGGLLCETREAKRLVFFEAGQLVGAKSSMAGERLGAILVREGAITKAQLDEATRFIRSGQKLGHILVELGHLRGGEIEGFVRLQILDIACAILISNPRRLVFNDKLPLEAVTLSPVSIGDVFLEAVKRLPDIEVYRENLLLQDYVMAQTADALAMVQGMALSEDEAYVLDLVDGENTVADILAQSPLRPEATTRILIALQQSGMASLEKKSATRDAAEDSRPTPDLRITDPIENEVTAFYNDVQCQNHWQILGLPRDASYLQIERAFQECSRRFDPEKYQHISDPDFQEKLGFLRARLKEAFLTLSSQTSTNVYDRLVDREDQYQDTKEKWEAIGSEADESPDRTPAKDPEEAKRLFKRAQAAFRERDFWNAIELCRAAIEMDDGNDPRRFHLLGRALAENPRWRKDAERNLKIAHKLEPWEPRYLISLGTLYQKEGLHQRARRIFEQVKAIDPDHPIPEITENEVRGSATEKSQKAG